MIHTCVNVCRLLREALLVLRSRVMRTTISHPLINLFDVVVMIIHIGSEVCLGERMSLQVFSRYFL
jgi:hypothetical protein